MVVNIRQAYLNMIKAYPGGWDAMAAALGMSRDALENRIYERKGQDVRVQTALQLQAFSNTTLFAEAVASMSHGSFVKLPSMDHIGNEEISGKFHEIWEELGQLSAEFRAFADDGKFDRNEREDFSALVDKIHTAVDQLRALTFRVYCPEVKAEANHG
jgi:hypothetical protein